MAFLCDEQCPVIESLSFRMHTPSKLRVVSAVSRSRERVDDGGTA